MKKWLTCALGCLALLALVGAGCTPEENPDTCDGVTCNGHGTCSVQAGSALCDCDDGYVNQGPLNCVPDTTCLKMGVPCSDSTECCDGWCLKYSDGTGYCAKRDCQGNDSCVNYNNDGREMCCVDVGGEFKVCLKIDPGCGCGTQDKTCGQDCSCQLDSACDPTNACLTGSSSYCSHECVTDNECNDCADPNDPDVLFSCVPISGGVTYCIADSEDTCTSNQDCTNGDECVPYLTADGTGLEGYCGRHGPLNVGDTCSEDDDQCAGFCMQMSAERDGKCASVCELDTDCPTGMMCYSVNFCIREPCDNPANQASIPMCLDDLRCLSGRDCLDAVEVCMPFLNDDGTGLEGWCNETNGLLPTGDPTCDPEADPDTLPPEQVCEAFYCFDGFCSEVCELDTDCPAPTACLLITFGLPNGGSASIPMCMIDDRCSKPADCPVDQGCRPYLGPDGASLEGHCETGGDIATGAVCDPNYTGTDDAQLCESAFCIDDNFARAFCTEVCEITTDCPTDMVCEPITFCLADPCSDPNNLADINMCVLPAPAGDQTLGQPCIFDVINADTDYCQADLACLGGGADPDNFVACGVDNDCVLEGFDVTYNPDCVNIDGTQMCGFSFCASECAAAAPLCPAGYVDEMVGNTCYCTPTPPTGTSTAGQPCPFGRVNPAADYCLEGLSCIGMAPDPASAVCTDNASCVTAELPASQNPYCATLADTTMHCGGSFCSAPCAAAAPLCETGFHDILVGTAQDCFCEPD